MEPDLGGYVRFKVNQKVRTPLIAANMDHDENYLAKIQEIMTEASAGLYLGADVLIDSLMTKIRRGGNIAAFLREAREDNEIMLQRDPEGMRNPVAGPSKRFNQGRITPKSKLTAGCGLAGLWSPVDKDYTTYQFQGRDPVLRTVRDPRMTAMHL